MSYKRTPSPCLNCEDRHAGCHGQCSKYIEWKADDMFKAKQRGIAKKVAESDVRNNILTIQKQNRLKKGRP